MSRFGGFLARKAGLFDKAETSKPHRDNPLELDEELFSALGAQLGGDNESLRNMLLDANDKIDELDSIKAAVGKLVDPVGKTLRALEAEKTEKLALQTVLNNTRTAYGKLRNEVAELERRRRPPTANARRCARNSPTTQSLLHTRSHQGRDRHRSSPPAARRSPSWNSASTQQTGENTSLREENRRLDERLTTTDKRIIALESDLKPRASA